MHFNMEYFLYIPLALLPSVVWLLWYLRRDKHPEPKSMVLMIFVWGMLIAFPAILIENVIIWAIESISLPEMLSLVVVYFLGVAVTEEALKFFAVKFRVLGRTFQLDEPIDAMIYMIIAALGFAAIENIFLLAPLLEKDFVANLGLVFSRFIGATFLHVLASAIIGYYLALALFQPAKRFLLLIHGFALAIILHGLYNILVIQMEESFYFVFPIAAMILFTATLISTFFKRLLKMKSVSLPPN